MKRVRAFLVAFVVMIASVLVMVSPAHACSWLIAQTVTLYAGSNSIGSVRLFVDGCGNAQGQLHDIVVDANQEIDIYSSTHTYSSYVRYGNYGASSNPVHVGNAQVAAAGYVYGNSGSGSFFWYGNTGYHGAY